MSELVISWHNDGPEPRKKRAGYVCTACHRKKTKCDVKERHRQGFVACSACALAGKRCQSRPSRSEAAKRRSQRNHQNPEFDAAGLTNADGNLNGNLAAIQPSDHVEFQPELSSTLASQQEQNGHLPTRSTPTTHAVTRAAAGHTPQTPHRTPDVPLSHYSDVDTGFLQLFRPERTRDAEIQIQAQITEAHATISTGNEADHPPLRLMSAFIETYFEYCFTWCPVLDVDMILEELTRSPLLSNALAVASSNVRPPLTPHDGPAAYYRRARHLFYDDEEPDAMLILKAALLFYWYSPRSTSMVHRHSSWWWTAVVIRHAQQMDLHREPSAAQTLEMGFDLGLRRRIWWTAFVRLPSMAICHPHITDIADQARERLTALCQSKPTIIEAEDCSIRELTMDDFPPSTLAQHRDKAEVFIHWVRLCGILGRMAQHLSRCSGRSSTTDAGPLHDLGQELVSWVSSLPPGLTLPIGETHTTAFNRNVHQLHLPYLCAVIILHMMRSSGPLPQALPPAVLAASCVARIYSDILDRGETRFLMAINSWYSSISFIALLQASCDHRLSEAACAEIDTITRMLGCLRKMWGTSEVVYQGLDRLRSQAKQFYTSGDNVVLTNLPQSTASMDGDPVAFSPSSNGIDWLNYFPFATQQTSKVAEHILAANSDDWFGGYDWQSDYPFQNLQDWFGPFDDPGIGMASFTVDF